MDDSSGLFTLIDDLVASFPPDPQRLAAVLKLQLLRDAAASSPVEEVWASAPSVPPGPFQSVMLRLPTGLGDEGPALLSLELSSSGEVHRSTIIDSMGPEFILQLPSARYTPGTVPAYLRYERPWGRLNFGIDPRGQGDLRELLLEIKCPADAEPRVPISLDAA